MNRSRLIKTWHTYRPTNIQTENTFASGIDLFQRSLVQEMFTLPSLPFITGLTDNKSLCDTLHTSRIVLDARLKSWYCSTMWDDRQGVRCGMDSKGTATVNSLQKSTTSSEVPASTNNAIFKSGEITISSEVLSDMTSNVISKSCAHFHCGYFKLSWRSVA